MSHGHGHGHGHDYGDCVSHQSSSDHGISPAKQLWATTVTVIAKDPMAETYLLLSSQCKGEMIVTLMVTVYCYHLSDRNGHGHSAW